MMSRRFAAHAVAALALLLVAGCPALDNILNQNSNSNSNDNDSTGLNNPSGLVRFKSANELLEFFRQQVNQRHTQNRGFFGIGAAAADASNETAGAADDGSSPDPFSTTNLQEEGVDESDVFKSDGTYFYVADGGKVRVVKAAPRSELAQVGEVTLASDVYVDSLYLHDGKLLALAVKYVSYDSIDSRFGRPELLIYPPYYIGNSVVLYEVDISNPAAPAVARHIELDGSLVSSRLTNNRVIVVLAIAPKLPDNPTVLSVNNLGLDDVLPQVRTGAGSAVMVGWENWLRPETADGYFMTAILTLDAGNIESILNSVAVLANCGTIYVSPEAVYLTDATYDMDDNYRQSTAVRKFAFDANGVAAYAASGKVPGQLLNQFSLGESDGDLRLATHIENFSMFVGIGFSDDVAVSSDVTQTADEPPAGPTNAVYVLRQSGESLDIVGRVENIAENERIYSARFIGDRGYLVTFRRIDPLFVLDLSDAASPKIAGELKVPGYSDYLHPIGTDRLIGVGRSALTTNFGNTIPDALQLSLFNVADPANPKLIEQIQLGGVGSASDVSYTHKAFTYLPQTGVLAIPAQLYKDISDPFVFGGIEFDGVLVFDVDLDAGFEALGRVASVVENDEFGYTYSAWRRASVIGDSIYALTPRGVRAAATTDFNTTTTVTFAE